MAEIRDELVLDIDQALRDITRVEQALDRSLAPVELRIDVDDTSVQRVEDSLRDVRTVAEDTTDQVRLTADEYREVARAIETGVTPARAIAEATGDLQRAATIAETDFRQVAQALDLSEDQARDLAREVIDAQQAAERLEDSAQDVARQLGLSEDEANRFVSSLRTAARHADDIDTRGRTLVTTFGSLRGVIGGITGALAVIGGGQILGAATRGVQAALTQFQALNESINATRVTFGFATDQILDFGEISAQVAGLSAAAFQQAVVPIGSVLTNFGFTAGEAADASIELVKRAADLASVFNTDVAEALLAINSALVGQVEPLRRYGAEISVARVEAFALATGIAASRDELDEQARTAARVGLILADTAKVQGDFVNTADELANAQRTATAEVQNFAAEVGEALAPAMAALVAILPEVLEGVRQLVPTFAAGADSAADFFQSINEGAGGFRGPVANFVAGLGLATDAANALGDVGSALFDTFTFEFNKAGQQVDQFGLRIARTSQRIAGSGLARDLDAGEDAALAFANALSFVARDAENVDVLSDSFRGFAVVAGLTKTELLDVTGFLIDNAVQAGFSAQEVAFLESQYALLRNTLFVVGNEVAQAARAMGETEQPFATLTSRFTTFTGDIETAQDRASAALKQLADDTAAQLGRAAQAFDLFGEAPEQIEGALADFVEGLQEQVEAQVDFDINLAILRALGLDQLAAEFEDAGVAAGSQLQEAVDNIPLAIEADRAARGFADDLAGTFEDELVRRLIELDISPGEARQIAATLVSPQVIDAVEEAGRSWAGAQTNEYRDALVSGLDQLVPDVSAALDEVATRGRIHRGVTWDSGGQEDAESYVAGFVSEDIQSQIETIFAGLGIDLDLFDEGAEGRKTLLDGLSSKQPGEATQLRDSIEDVVRDGLQMQSPSLLMLRIGEEAGDSFWSGFNQSELTLKTPAPGLTGSISSTTAATNVVEGGFTFAPTVINPTVQDLETTLARQGQLFGAVSGALGRVGRALPK